MKIFSGLQLTPKLKNFCEIQFLDFVIVVSLDFNHEPRSSFLPAHVPVDMNEYGIAAPRLNHAVTSFDLDFGLLTFFIF